MTLADLWITSQGSLEDKKVDQIIKFAGSGRLLDGNDCSKEFTELLAQVPSRYLRKYAEECLSERFDDSGAALQDIVNEVGRRLGFNVTNGRYRGISQQIGHDGLWRTEDGPALVVECKTTSAYQIRLDVVAGYRRRLAAAGEITEDASSILIVVGREDTTDLEAQVRGSRHAWDIRLLSVEALLRLMESKEAADDPEILRQVREVLVPQEFTN